MVLVAPEKIVSFLAPNREREQHQCSWFYILTYQVRELPFGIVVMLVSKNTKTKLSRVKQSVLAECQCK